MVDESQHDRLARIERELTDHDFPPQLVVETTSRCNLKCVHCAHRSMHRPAADMAPGLWRAIVEEVAAERAQCEVWPTFYGEALLLGPRLFEMLDYADRVGCRNLVLNSNGTMLSRPGMIEAVLDSPLKRFILSLDGYRSATFEAVRVGASHEKVYRAVAELLERKARRGGEHPIIQCQFSVMEHNSSEVDEFTRHWRGLGAEVKLRRKLTWCGAVEASWMEPDRKLRIACPWGHNAAAILQDGRLVACAIDYEGRFTAGDVARDGIKKLWRGPHRRLLRLPHRRHQWEQLPRVCAQCLDWQAVGADYQGPHGELEGARPFWHREEGNAR